MKNRYGLWYMVVMLSAVAVLMFICTDPLGAIVTTVACCIASLLGYREGRTVTKEEQSKSPEAQEAPASEAQGQDSKTGDTYYKEYREMTPEEKEDIAAVFADLNTVFKSVDGVFSEMDAVFRNADKAMMEIKISKGKK